jgi:hypothetical protein
MRRVDGERMVEMCLEAEDEEYRKIQSRMKSVLALLHHQDMNRLCYVIEDSSSCS